MQHASQPASQPISMSSDARWTVGIACLLTSQVSICVRSLNVRQHKHQQLQQTSLSCILLIQAHSISAVSFVCSTNLHIDWSRLDSCSAVRLRLHGSGMSSTHQHRSITQQHNNTTIFSLCISFLTRTPSNTLDDWGHPFNHYHK